MWGGKARTFSSVAETLGMFPPLDPPRTPDDVFPAACDPYAVLPVFSVLPLYHRNRYAATRFRGETAQKCPLIGRKFHLWSVLHAFWPYIAVVLSGYGV